MTGIDLSTVSIGHAQREASENGLEIDYRVGDYTAIDLGGAYDAAVLIYLDFGVLADASRDRLLDAVYGALRPGGAFAFDVNTPVRRRVADGRIEVTRSSGGFWRRGPHPLVETSYRYDSGVDLDQHTVVNSDGITTYRVWDRACSRSSLRRLLEQHGFTTSSVWTDLTGRPWESRSPTIAVTATASRARR